MFARVPGHHSGGHLPKRHHGDEAQVMFLPSVDANLTVCQSGLTRNDETRWMRAHPSAAFENRSFMPVSVFRINRLLILDLRSHTFVALAWVSVREKSEITIERRRRCALIRLFGAASASAFAAPHLSQHACHSYAFVKPAHEATHGDLMQELKDLSQVGYEEHAVGDEYSSDLEAAQERLGKLYRHDCLAYQSAAAEPPIQPGVQAQVQSQTN